MLRPILAALVLSVAALSSPAQATTINATFHGQSYLNWLPNHTSNNDVFEVSGTFALDTSAMALTFGGGSYGFYTGEAPSIFSWTVNANGINWAGSSNKALFYYDTANNEIDITDNGGGAFGLQLGYVTPMDLGTLLGLNFTLSLSNLDWSHGFVDIPRTLITNFTFDQITFSSSDLSQVPVPAALPLFGSALVGLVGFGRKTKKAAK
jgi:hypothetical protein